MILNQQFVMVHAGIPPQWSMKNAFEYANQATKLMRADPILFLEKIYGNHPAAWNANLTESDRVRYIVNALTRMRFCDARGTLDLDNKTDVASHQEDRPWFEWIDPQIDVYFGHWAAINGHSSHPRIFALDTGCAWGGSLRARNARTAFTIGSRSHLSLRLM